MYRKSIWELILLLRIFYINIEEMGFGKKVLNEGYGANFGQFLVHSSEF